ncbi:hypothetical protein CAAN1_34S00364 [[Candida] anglica]|uniref:YMC020W-like alpha/beta hydrolase domain-containing protein n=1 Tax=[Candida] anglica TaxID=148631 RepID=A0ABP0E9W2_9ASCO
MSRAPSISIQGSWLPWSSNSEVQHNEDVPKGRSASPTSGQQHQQEQQGEESTLSNRSSSFPALGQTNWLAWTRARSTSEIGARMEEKDGDGNNEEAIEDGNREDEEDNEDNEEDPNSGNEIDDHVSKKQSSTWNFWNGGGSTANGNSNDNNNDNSNNSDGKKKKLTNFSNTILKSDHSFEGANPSKHSQVDRANDGNNNNSNSDEDDAVLYKPHTDAQQFREINTHKNENLKENVIVPNWDSCLPNQTARFGANNSIIGSIFGNSSTSNNTNNLNSKMDLKNWRQFLNQLSSKLGFSSQSLTSVVESENGEQDNVNKPNNVPSNVDDVEKEFHLLYEKTYRLYGRSLAKLPEQKRACLPNYNKYYGGDSGDKNDQEQLSRENRSTPEDEEDENDISISNDPMGNLLINHNINKRATSTNADIHSIKTGPLQKIKKILIIGVHGFFPTRMIRPIIGSPKGTSLKFANEAEKGIIRYCVENNLITENESKVSIQKIALEKEGKILDRVDFFTDILKKWSDELNEADFIFVAAHSQGCVVSIILLARLINLGILKDPSKKRIAVLGMAGVNNGPFYGVDKSLFMKAYSAIENESMLELFELTKFTSKQSLVYKESIQTIINNNVKICLIGSINDQLVPLYSALSSHTFHPNIYRACYIDHASQTPLFIQKLVSMCCQLQNLGFFDNNVIKELSTILAGPLTGNGHSKIYNDGKVYDLGIKFALDTDDVVIPTPFASEEESIQGLVTSGVGTYGSIENSGDSTKLVKQFPITNQIYIKEYNIGKIGSNPYLLPWCLRGLLFNIEKNWPNNNKLLTVESGSDFGKNGYDEINEFYELFENWKPDSKLFKELKYRLNGIRASKL